MPLNESACMENEAENPKRQNEITTQRTNGTEKNRLFFFVSIRQTEIFL